ncbi:alkylation response protein AidB-like acyl-CoA dehydrogenase [Crossiella equi]|uniref:Alkylation response protein AidB-like acyl-CoA dehydrogenase n=1 Tax=Crossiella equi TaxID=130796 RepID=A0ABS5AP24_9PSEU|nr:acyl-CoA dehydrogenase family protein [Crossiella equi]MBP2478312.1 alkylation response protein AidB-like acyl-CoA dehydrogenase [Crossiella equi]
MTTSLCAAALEAAADLAEHVLLPAAAGVEAADRVPDGHFEALAAHGFYDLASLRLPDLAGTMRLVEVLAGGCLTTTFVWMQHHGAVRSLGEADNAVLAAAHLPELRAGAYRAGLAVTAALRPGPPAVTATPVPGGYRLDGEAPWVTGWGLVDLLLVAGRTPDGRLAVGLVDAVATPTLHAQPLDLLAVRASRTVRLRFDGHLLPYEELVHVVPTAHYLAHEAETQHVAAAMALGVAGRAITLLGEHAAGLPAQLTELRRRLAGAGWGEEDRLRAAAAELAHRAAATLLTHEGGRALLPGSHAGRLLREAAFLLVFASRPVVRTALLDRFRR